MKQLNAHFYLDVTVCSLSYAVNWLSASVTQANSDSLLLTPCYCEQSFIWAEGEGEEEKKRWRGCVNLSTSNEDRQANTQQRQPQSELPHRLILPRKHQHHSDITLTDLDCFFF